MRLRTRNGLGFRAKRCPNKEYNNIYMLSRIYMYPDKTVEFKKNRKLCPGAAAG